MTLDSIREYCRSLPHVTEDVKWGNDLCFLIGNKMFAVVSLDQKDPGLGFKCTPEVFAELTEIDGIIPAPYLARYHWVKMLKSNALRDPAIREHLKDSYELVKQGLPKKLRNSLGSAAKPKKAHARAKKSKG